MKILYPFVAVLGLIIIAAIGSQAGLEALFGIVFPYLALLIFLGGFINKVVGWAKSPVPFRIPTTCGQANSLPWIKQDCLDCPSTTTGVLARMALEIFLFRSLFRNTQADVYDGPKLRYGSSKYLWLFGLLFHYAFLVIIVRHLRLFADPIPFFVNILEYADGFLQIGLPHLYQSDLVILGAITLLFLRRIILTNVRYISLPADYFPLFLIFSIAATGMLMRYVTRVDIVAVKQLAVGLTTLHPSIVGDLGMVFYVHIFLVCTLLVYFPFSKLMHMGGVFMSPTRNLANNSRMVRHINPWNDPNLKPHSYAAYEDEFREFMVDADIPVDKELPVAAAEATTE
ncbi:MAG: sulfate reduction electron transfer complex DsrMKJOP subunit DsrM [Desulfobulbaceae bacterium]|nr:sulfate reduction electron transfer complex DsrMKJOP subunit DsrM [Desulfobulbaceae bacterium]